MNRHPRLKECLGTNLCSNRREALGKDRISNFFNLVGQIYEVLFIFIFNKILLILKLFKLFKLFKFFFFYFLFYFFVCFRLQKENPCLIEDPDRIWNCDESNIHTEPLHSKVLGAKDVKHLSILHTNAEATYTTSINAISAGGKAIDIEFVKSKDAKVYPQDQWMLSAMKPSIRIHTSENGFVSKQIFLDWFRNTFLPQARKIVDDNKPILLFLDGASPHIDIELVSIAIKHNIIIVLLPSHTSSHIQVGKFVFINFFY